MYRHPYIPFVIHSSSNLQSFLWSGLTLSCSLPPSLPRRRVFLRALGTAHCVQILLFSPCPERCGAVVGAGPHLRVEFRLGPGPAFTVSCPHLGRAEERCRQLGPHPAEPFVPARPRRHGPGEHSGPSPSPRAAPTASGLPAPPRKARPERARPPPRMADG